MILFSHKQHHPALIKHHGYPIPPVSKNKNKKLKHLFIFDLRHEKNRLLMKTWLNTETLKSSCKKRKRPRCTGRISVRRGSTGCGMAQCNTGSERQVALITCSWSHARVELLLTNVPTHNTSWGNVGDLDVCLISVVTVSVKHFDHVSVRCGRSLRHWLRPF